MAPLLAQRPEEYYFRCCFQELQISQNKLVLLSLRLALLELRLITTTTFRQLAFDARSANFAVIRRPGTGHQCKAAVAPRC